MKKLLRLMSLLMLAAPAVHAQEKFSHGLFDDVVLVRPQEPARSMVLLLSGAQGWNAHQQNLAQGLSNEGALVAGISLPALLAKLDEGDAACVFPDGDFDNLSHWVQGYARLPGYFRPWLAGDGEGAALAYALLAQGAPGAFAGALTLGFCPQLALRKPLCKGERVHFAPRAKTGVLDLLPAPALPLPWIDLHPARGAACALDTAKRFVTRVPGAQFKALPGPVHAQRGLAQWLPAWREAFAALSANQRAAVPAPAGALADLPLIELPAAGSGDSFVVLLSGDGGWAGLDQEVAAALTAKGVPVVGVDSLRYFWRARTPESLAADLSRVLSHYAARFKRPHAILVGYSQGADVLPFALNRMPQAERERVSRLVLMGLGERAAFEFHVGNWVGGDDAGLPILPEMLRLRADDTLCLYGQDEDDSLCPKIPPGHVRAVALPGGHHFDGAYGRLADLILHAPAAPTNSGSR